MEVFNFNSPAATSLGLTPQMGVITWNYQPCSALQVTADRTKLTADKMVELGLFDAGYKFLIQDDCWQAQQRDADGKLQANPVTFKDGIKSVADYAHGKNLKFGIVSSAGTKTCLGNPGSVTFEKTDAKTFSDWGVDYLKYDNCYTNGASAFNRFTSMSTALKASGRDIFYSISNWGNEDVTTWGKNVAQSWRTASNIALKPNKQNQWQYVKSNFLIN